MRLNRAGIAFLLIGFVSTAQADAQVAIVQSSACERTGWSQDPLAVATRELFAGASLGPASTEIKTFLKKKYPSQVDLIEQFSNASAGDLGRALSELKGAIGNASDKADREKELSARADEARGSASADERKQLRLVRAVVSDLVQERLRTEFQQNSLVRQLGSDPNNATATSKVAKAVSSVFSTSLEYGTLHQSTVSGDTRQVGTNSSGQVAPGTETASTVTFRGRPLDAVLQGVMGRGYLNGAATPCDPKIVRILGMISGSATFLTSGSTSPLTTSDGSFSQENLTAWSIRLEFLNTRDSRSASRARGLRGIAEVSADKLTSDEWQRLLPKNMGATASASLKSWLQSIEAEATTLPASATPELVSRKLEHALDIAKTDRSTLVDPLLNSVVDALVEQQRSKFFHEAAQGHVAALEFSVDGARAGAIPVNNVRAIYGHAFLAGGAELTINYNVAWYPKSHLTGVEVPPDGQIPPDSALKDVSSNRDQSFVAQGDLRVGTAASNLGAVSGTYSIKKTNSIAYKNDTGIILSFKGLDNKSVWAVQAKWTLPRGSTVVTPISITWSNDQALLRQEKQIKGTFGVSFDLDSALTHLSPHPR
jgi:hypothetical protein